MENSEEDILASSHEILGNLINKYDASPSKAIAIYLDQLKVEPIDDFQSGLEWFNVSESLSLKTQLQGKLVLMDFFTYCCINCMHVLPELKALEEEFSIENGFVVIGVHSAKFDNEKDSKNILAAVQRYNITHPVVNDINCNMWKKCHVPCWPTLLLVSPNGQPIVMLMGEGHKTTLQLYIRHMLTYYETKEQISKHQLPLRPANYLKSPSTGPLLFPGKIASFIDGAVEYLAVSDTGHNRILILQDGTLKYQVGSGICGFIDGDFENTRFNNPQGLTFQSGHILYVADTQNHAVRRIDCQLLLVSTVAGYGKQSNDLVGGDCGTRQGIASPWDCAIYRTTNDDCQKDVLLVAMAGLHQIWAVFLEDTVWWRNKFQPGGSVVCIAGSGKEENRNNLYAHTAGFAQPSGLAVGQKSNFLYIADSESSSIRRLSLLDGKVTAVVGGDRNPNITEPPSVQIEGGLHKTSIAVKKNYFRICIITPSSTKLFNRCLMHKNLFAYGDQDGIGYEAKLQHALGITLTQDESHLYIADTYNHKIKSIDVTKNAIKTLNYRNASFNEPGGLCIGQNSILYISDTNNHAIQKVQLNIEIGDVEKLTIHFPKMPPKNNILNNKILSVNSNGGNVHLKINLLFVDGLVLTPGAPQVWSVVINNEWTCNPEKGRHIKSFEFTLNAKPTIVQPSFIDIVVQVMACRGDICFPKDFVIRQQLIFNEMSLQSVEEVINVKVGEKAIVFVE